MLLITIAVINLYSHSLAIHANDMFPRIPHKNRHEVNESKIIARKFYKFRYNGVHTLYRDHNQRKTLSRFVLRQSPEANGIIRASQNVVKGPNSRHSKVCIIFHVKVL